MPGPRTLAMATLLDPRAAHFARADRQKAVLGRWLKLALAAVLAAIGLRTFVYEPFNIPSESMLPGLLVGDYLFVAKFPYGFSRFSFPLAMPLIDGRIGGGLPARGDIIVFKTPRDNRTDYIKRVIGLPGDRLAMVRGAIDLNGTRLARRAVASIDIARGAAPGCVAASVAGGCRFAAFAETLPGGRAVTTLDIAPGRGRDDMPEVVVPPGHVFVLGDNRDDSADSRFSLAEGGVGMVPLANIVGRADRIFFSIDPAARVADPVHWRDHIRTGRIGRAL